MLIAPGGRLLLADFGVARLETEDSLVTRTGALLGTPAYMSPEQASGDLVTAQSDLYSLGATLYQLATGALPYSGSPAKVISMIASGNLVAPVRRRPSCGPDLSRLIERVMATEPSARPVNATAIASELRALAATGGFGDATEELAAYFEDPDGFLRTRTPTVVAALVTQVRTAVADAKLPRAMALADRASALAPADPTVTALIQTVTEGGDASRRKRRLAIAGIVVVLAGGATALGWRLARSSVVAIPAIPLDAPQAGDAAIMLDAPAVLTIEPGDAAIMLDGPTVLTIGPGDATIVFDGPAAPAITPLAASAAPARDAGVPAIPAIPSDAAVRRIRDAPVGAPPSDTAAPIDAHPLSEPPGLDAAIVPASTVGHLIVRNDVWCNVWIDGNNRGNQRNETIEVTVGHHVVRCVNPAGEWTQETDVAPGTTQTLTGTLLRELRVTLEIDATIDGKYYPRGTVVKLRPGNIEVTAGGTKKFITFRGNCTLKDSPELGCYL